MSGFLVGYAYALKRRWTGALLTAGTDTDLLYLLVRDGALERAETVQPESVAAADGGDVVDLLDRDLFSQREILVPLIERKCGYAPGSWDGNNLNMSNGIMTCGNGRRVDDPEVRAMMEVAGGRISRRVNAVMQRPEIRNAIAAVARQASGEALAELDMGGRERRRRR